jgi:hypothetical protein
MTYLLTRIEPRTRSPSIEPGLGARVWDAAWFLAQQWVLGEFDGEDAGSPVQADLDLEIHRLTVLRMAGGTQMLDAAAAPLDVLVERERVRSRESWTARQRIDVGREFLHRLSAAGLGDSRANVVAAYPTQPATPEERRRDPEGAALLDVAAGRLPDGYSLYADAANPGGAVIGLTASAALNDALDGWRDWLWATLEEPRPGDLTPPWDPERLESTFAIGSPSLSADLSAEEYRGGGLDWYSFDRLPRSLTTTVPERRRIARVPTPVRFRGMPNPRYWEFEDATIDLGSVDAAPTDLARMALLEFAFAYGNDMFALPVGIPLGTVSGINSLTVTDTFGIVTNISAAVRPASAATGGWAFLALAAPGGAREAGLVLPPVIGHSLHGPPLEEIRLMRDEMANLVWGIEARTEGGAGRAVVPAESDGIGDYDVTPPDVASALFYRLQTQAPPTWYPYVLQPGLLRKLELKLLAPSTEVPRGTLLGAPGTLLRDEEVPREGTRLTREYAMGRWINGRRYVWSRKIRRTGRGEGSSGLRYDVAEQSASTF